MLALLLMALQGAGDPAQAVLQLQQAIRSEPGRETLYTDLGNVLLSTQNFKEAALVLENAKSRFPESAQVRLSLGVAYYGQRRFPDAVGAFLEAAHRDTAAEQPVAFLGRILEHAGPREEEVKSVFAKYAETHPANFLGHFLYGKAARDAAALRKSISLQPRFPESHFELGSLLEQNSDWKGAAAAFERSARLAPKNPAPQYRLMRVYARLGLDAKSAAAKLRHEALVAQEKAEADKRQAAAKHMDLRVKP
ncbi:MAG: tetratricopeptide repeat protein [Acidobacteria bacterium]|nr:tetratricopeptide repeat protein [Acidobacteriota bacterium]